MDRRAAVSVKGQAVTEIPQKNIVTALRPWLNCKS